MSELWSNYIKGFNEMIIQKSLLSFSGYLQNKLLCYPYVNQADRARLGPMSSQADYDQNPVWLINGLAWAKFMVKLGRAHLHPLRTTRTQQIMESPFSTQISQLLVCWIYNPTIESHLHTPNMSNMINEDQWYCAKLWGPTLLNPTCSHSEASFMSHPIYLHSRDRLNYTRSMGFSMIQIDWTVRLRAEFHF